MMRLRFRFFRHPLASVAFGLAMTGACLPMFGASVRPAVPGASAGVTAFVNVAVVPMDTERVLPRQIVLVEGGRITTIGPVGRVAVPAGAARIEGQEQFLMPGLADMHVHLTGFDSVSAVNRLLIWLANGITTVRNMDDRSARWFKPRLPSGYALRLRARAAAGESWSPRIYTAGPWMGNNHDESSVPPDSIAWYVAAYQAAGYDFIKPYNENGLVFDSLVTTSRRMGITLQGHVPPIGGATALERALTTHKSIEHLTGYFSLSEMQKKGRDTADLRRLVEATRRAGVWNCPTLALLLQHLQVQQARTKIVAADESTLRRQFVKALQDAGAGLLLGTDGSVLRAPEPRSRADSLYGDPGAIYQELEALVGAGLTPYQALVTGTRNVADFLGTLDETGTVAVGKRADIVLLRANPLIDIRHTVHPVGVMIGGRWLPRSEIDRRLAEIRAAVAGSP